MAALERGLRQIVNNCITTNKTYDSGRRPETATIASDFTWRYLQVLGWFDSTGFSFARKTIKVANVSSGRFCVIWRSHPNKGISYFTHVCHGNNISFQPVFGVCIWDRIFQSIYPLGVSVWFKRLPAMCCVLAWRVESEWLSSDAFQVPSPWVFCPTNVYKRSQINIINVPY